MITHSKLPNVGTNIFTVMSSLATEHKAVNLGQGFPDFQMDEGLTDLVNKAMRDGYNQYAPMPGWLPLRESIAAKIDFLYNRSVDPDSEITITPGGTYAIYTALTAILDPGDEVMIFEPAYDSYIPNIEVNGGKAITINLEFPAYKINWKEVKKKISARTKAILINTPQNPTGSVLSEEDISELKSIVHGKNIFIISDEVYEHLIFDDLPHLSMMKYPELFEKTFACFSFGKVYNCTGWKLGYCVAPAALMKEFRKIHQFNCFSCNTPMQVGLAQFLSNKEAYLGLGKSMQKRRDYFIQLMKKTKFEMLNSSGSYFICASYKNISDERDNDFAVRMTKEAKVASIPVSSFYRDGVDNKVLRFCFSKKNETLEAAVEKLIRFTS